MIDIEIPENLKDDIKEIEVSVFDPTHPYIELREWAKSLLKSYSMDDIDYFVDFRSNRWKAKPDNEPSNLCPATKSPRVNRKLKNRKRNKIAKLSKKKNR